MEKRVLAKKMKVIHVVPPSFGYSFSGIFYIMDLIRNWKSSEIELELYGSDFLKRDDRTDNLFKRAMKHSRLQELKWTLKLLLMLIIKRKEYDIVHYHVQWWGALISSIMVQSLGKKTIYQMSLLGSDNPTAVRSEAFGQLKLNIFKEFNGVVGVSRALIDDCYLHNFSSELSVLPAFYGVTKIEPVSSSERLLIRQCLNIPSQAEVIVFVGSMIERKGLDLVVDVFIELAEKRGNLTLILIGPNAKDENPRLDEHFVNEQKQKILKAGLHNRAVWTGLISDRTLLKQYYQSSDLFLFPTRREGQGNVILEAMAYGLPVIVTRIEGITDMMVTSEKNGYLIDKNDLSGFINAVNIVLNDKELCLKLGETGRNIAIESFGFEEYCKKLTNFYRRVINHC